MDLKHAGLGVVIFLVFWAFQVGYFDSLGTVAWFAAVVIFSALMVLIGKMSMPKASPDMKMLWNFTIGFSVVSTLIASFAMPYIGVVLPLGYSMSSFTPLLVSLWFVVFGAAMFATGWQSKMNVTLVMGVIWIFSSILTLSMGPNSYIFFGWITGLSFVIAGLLKGKRR